MTIDIEPAEPSPEVEDLIFGPPVEHPDEFVRQLTGITAPWVDAWRTNTVWFRGNPLLSMTLEPSLLRYRPRSLVGSEKNLLMLFRSYGARLLDRMPAGPLELMTVMQHHGVPTRLLDWTQNAFGALYFAVRQHEHHGREEDAVVWVLEPLRLAEIQIQARMIPVGNEEVLTSKLPLPVPLLPVHASERMAPQRGAFTFHPFTPQHSLVKLALAETKNGRPSFLRGLRIKAGRRAFLRDALVNAFGMGEFTFFPDLDGLARELRMKSGMEGKG